MELKPGYKQTDVGVIPEDWDVLKVESIIDEISMGPFGSDITVSNFVSSGVPVLSGLNVASERLLDSFENFVTPAKSRSLKKAVARKGDIVVTHRGTIGQIAYIPENSEYDRYVVSQSQFRVRFCEDAVIPVWVVLYFHSKNGAKRLLEGKGHTGVPAIAQPTSTFRNLSIPVPPRPEQIAIATALSDVDALLEGLDRLIAKKRDLKQAAMQQLLTGETRLPGFSEEWKPLNMGRSSYLKARIGWQGLTTAEYLDSGDYGLVTGTDFRDGRIDWSGCYFVEQSRYDQDRFIQLKVGDVLVTKDGTIGKAAYIDHLPFPTTLNSGVFVMRPLNDSYMPKYFFYVLMSRIFTDFLNKLAAGSTISHLYQKDFIGFEYSAPPTKEEQSAIAEVLSDMDAEIEALQCRRAKTANLKQAMMQELLTGKTRLVEPQAS
jgi:type I restriction enzyme S subunit